MKISVKDALEDKNALIIDVRSPKEFEEDHIPGAVSMPILDDEERHLVGWTYKQDSVDKAYELGWEIFYRKIEDIEKFVEKNKSRRIIFACARGGFRSGCFVEHFAKHGRQFEKLDGGYKGFRAYVREELHRLTLPKNIVILYGLTGSGKTLIIRKLMSKYNGIAIDLEGLARHRSSLFGAVGLSPVSQKAFETALYFQLHSAIDSGCGYIIFEGESRKVGDAEIPRNVFNAMMHGIKINIECGIDTRASRIMEEYFDSAVKIEEVKRVVPKMVSLIGGKKTDHLLQLLSEEKYFDFCKEMLENYYDPLYAHFSRDFKFSNAVSSEDLDLAVGGILEFCNNL